MISQTTRYALTILQYLADRPGDWVQGSQIAADTNIPANYLSKILNQLRKRGFVLSQKGWGGGFQIRPEAGSQPILDVLETFEGTPQKDLCIFGLTKCDRDNPCPLHDRWEGIQKAYRDMLASVTVAELGKRNLLFE